MITVSATKFRNDLFTFLKDVQHGKTLAITHKGKTIAQVVPEKKKDWRDHMRSTPQLLVQADELVQPVDDDWVDYS